MTENQMNENMEHEIGTGTMKRFVCCVDVYSGF